MNPKRAIIGAVAEAVEFGFWAGINGAQTAHDAFCLLPLGERVSDAVLDTLLGPADRFEYVSTTTPTSPPPTIS